MVLMVEKQGQDLKQTVAEMVLLLVVVVVAVVMVEEERL